MDDDLIWAGADDLAQWYRAKKVSPVEVVEATLEQMERVNPALNMMVTVTADAAREQARKAEEAFQRGDDLPPLYGVPITIKDLTDTAGVRTTYGSVAYADHVPDTDSLAYERIRAAGTILLGKTTTPEFGLLGVTESKLTGTTGNPWDPSRTSGGSSGGAAAATVAGVGPLAWGSDGGGSIRVPSSVCGAVGIKPTTGRIPHAHNDEPDTTDGPITRTVVDAAMLLDVTAGPHPGDRLALPYTGDKYAEAARNPRDLAGMRIAANVNLGVGPIDPGTRAVFGQALDDLRSAGAIVEEVPIELPDVVEYFLAYWGPEYSGFAQQLEEAGIETWPKIQEIARRGRAMSPEAVSAAMRGVKTRIYETFTAILGDFDFFVCPTTPVPAFPHVGDIGGPTEVDGEQLAEPGLFFHRLTEAPAHAGLPAISVPCGFTPEELPVGLQVVGRLYDDVGAIGLAAAYERITPWTERHPSL